MTPTRAQDIWTPALRRQLRKVSTTFPGRRWMDPAEDVVARYLEWAVDQGLTEVHVFPISMGLKAHNARIAVRMKGIARIEVSAIDY